MVLADNIRAAPLASAIPRHFTVRLGQYQGSANTFGNTTTYYGPSGQYQGSSNSFSGGLNNGFGTNGRRGFGGFQ
jgi:hypothetical protein